VLERDIYIHTVQYKTGGGIDTPEPPLVDEKRKGKRGEIK